MPAAWMRTRTSSGPGSGRSSSVARNTSGAPKASNVTARMRAMRYAPSPCLSAASKGCSTALVIVLSLDERARRLDGGALGIAEAPREKGQALGGLNRRRRITRNCARPFLRLGLRILHHRIEQPPAHGFLRIDVARHEQHFEGAGRRKHVRQMQ